MTEPEQILAAAEAVLVIDWPSRDVPESLVRSGRTVVVRGGPGPEDYNAWALEGGNVVVRPLGHPPEHADLVYAFRPVEELPMIIATAVALGAPAIWLHTAIDRSLEEAHHAREMIEAAGLTAIDHPDLPAVLRGLQGRNP